MCEPKTSSKDFALVVPSSGGACMANLAALSGLEVSWEQSCSNNMIRNSSSNFSPIMFAITLSSSSYLTGSRYWVGRVGSRRRASEKSLKALPYFPAARS